MGSEAGVGGYFEGSDFIRVEPCKFKVAEYVSYYGVSQIHRIEITKYRKEPGSTIKENRDAPYYHVMNIDTHERNQEFNNTLKKDRIANLLYA